MDKSKSRFIFLLIVLGLNLGFVHEAKAQFLKSYEEGIVEIIKCNDRSGFDLGIIDVLSSLVRLSVFFMGFLMVAAITFNKSTVLIKTIIFMFLAFSGVNVIYEVGIKTHIDQAKDLSVFAAKFQRIPRPSLNLPPLTPGEVGVGDGTDIFEPPTGSGGLTVLPPPPPLQGITQGELRGEALDNGSNSIVCQPN